MLVQLPAAPNVTFDASMCQVQNASARAIVTTNYGSHAAGNGGDAAEAANRVAYANIAFTLARR